MDVLKVYSKKAGKEIVVYAIDLSNYNGSENADVPHSELEKLVKDVDLNNGNKWGNWSQWSRWGRAPNMY